MSFTEEVQVKLDNIPDFNIEERMSVLKGKPADFVLHAAMKFIIEWQLANDHFTDGHPTDKVLSAICSACEECKNG